jgi:hypothetical protein
MRSPTTAGGFVLVVVALAGCGPNKAPELPGGQPGQRAPAAPPKPDRQGVRPEFTIRVTPAEFFSGELKRLEPHLDFTATLLFKVVIEGSATLEPHVEVWADGDRVDREKYGIRADEQSDEVSFTVRREPRDKHVEPMYRVSLGGMREYVRHLEIPTPRTPAKFGFGPASLNKPFELNPGNKSVVVWVMGDGDGIDLGEPAEEVERQLKKQAWVMCLRLRAEKKEAR